MRSRNDGFVLVTVLWVVALLAVITISYHHRARLEVRAARYSLDASQARLAAHAAFERAKVELANRASLQQLAPLHGAAPTFPSTHLGQSWAQPVNLFDQPDLLSPGEGFENDIARYHIEDLERRININLANEALLSSLPGIPLGASRRINYRLAGGPDADEGAQPFQHLSELRDIQGIDDTAWYGGDGSPGLRDLLTVYGDGRVNINTAPLATLLALPDVDQTALEEWIEIRKGDDGMSDTGDDRGVGSWEEFTELTGISGDTLSTLQRFCKFNSNYFKISAVATRRGGKVRSQCSAIVLVPEGSNTASLLSWSEDSLGSP